MFDVVLLAEGDVPDRVVTYFKVGADCFCCLPLPPSSSLVTLMFRSVCIMRFFLVVVFIMRFFFAFLRFVFSRGVFSLGSEPPVVFLLRVCVCSAIAFLC